MTDQDSTPTAEPGSPLGRLLSIAEVGTIFNRDARTLRRWEKAGHLMPVRIWRSLFYRRDEVERLLVQRMTDAALARANGGEPAVTP